jgi:Domain of unknown function (DUF4352)
MGLRRGCVLLVVGAVAAAGCGSKTKTTTATHSTTSAASTSTPTTAAGPRDCNTLGINPTGMREGTCTHAGLTYVIVNRNHTLKLNTLSANVESVNAVSALSGAQPTGGQGKFVIASVSITNQLAAPQTVDKSGTQQLGLILDGTVYKEATAAEKSSDPSSCAVQQGKFTKGSSVSCQVVFQVPAAAAADLGKHGRADLYVVDFGSDLASGPPPQTVGEVRLYQ